ncbi:MAG TPA: hypothetical protein VN758_08760, partial [Solirubrobacterales bacterium]|nr:hypothetical protein [Solirubrobacterales bacterium]
LDPSTPAHRNRSLVLAGVALAVMAIVVAVIALTGGGGGGDASTAGDVKTGVTTTPIKKQKPAPRPLSKSVLISKADAICADSKATYKAAREEFPNGENEPDPTYSRRLTEISTRAVRRFNSLNPPAAVRKPFGEYVKAQERVKAYDREALQAAEAGEPAAYLAARESRDNEAGERYDLARAVGLRECSTNRQ